MNNAVPMVEVWRGDFLESLHRGAAVVCDERGEIVQIWGNPDRLILPRSSCKMIQALPLITSGAANAFGLAPQHLALEEAVGIIRLAKHDARDNQRVQPVSVLLSVPGEFKNL